MPQELPQAVAHRVIDGGCKTPKRIATQLKYLARITGSFKSKDSDEQENKPTVKLRLSARYGEQELKPEDVDKLSDSWALQSGIYQPGQTEADSKKELTTHLAVSLPPGTPLWEAEQIGLEWARILFHSGRFGAEWDYVTAFHSDRQHPHTHAVVNRRAFPPENSHGRGMGKWLKIAHRNEPDEELAVENGKEFGINYKILRAAEVEAAAKFGIALEATSRKERGLDSPSLNHGQYRQQLRIGIGEVMEHKGYIPEKTFGDLLGGHSSGPSPQAKDTPGQVGAQQSGGSSDGSVSPPDVAVDQRRNAAMRVLGLQADDPMNEDIERSPQAAADPLRQDNTEQGEATDVAGQAKGQQNDQSASGPMLLRNTAVDPHRKSAAMQQRQQRRVQAGDERDRSADEGPSRRKTPRGVELQVDAERRLAAMQERGVQADEERDRRVNEVFESDGNHRKNPHDSVLESISETGVSKAKGDSEQENTATGRRGLRGKRRAHDPERIIEARAQKAGQPAAEQSTAAPQGMKLRNTPAREARAQRDEQRSVERNQDDNTRSGKQRGGRARRSNRRSSR